MPSTRTLEGVGRQVTTAIAATSASQAGVVLLALLASVLQARLLGPEGRGELARFMNASALALLLFGLGMAPAITYFVASGRTSGRAVLIRLGPTYFITVVAVMATAAVVLKSPLATLLPESLSGEQTTLLLGGFFAAAQAAGLVAAAHIAEARFRWINASSVTVAVGVVVGTGLLLAAPAANAVIGVLVLLVALEVLRVAMLVWGYRGSWRAEGHSERRAAVSFAQLWRYSAMSYVADLLQFLIYRVDMWIVDAFDGAAALGVYALAVSLAQLVWIVPAAAARVIFPYATSSPESAELAWRGARASVAISAVLGFAGCIASVFLVVPLFGQGFEDVPQLLAVLMLGVVPFAGAKVLGSYLAGTDAVGLNAASSAVMLVVAVPLYVVLIDAHGPLGAAAATAAVYAAHTLVLTGIFVRRVRLPLHSALRVTWSGEGTSADD